MHGAAARCPCRWTLKVFAGWARRTLPSYQYLSGPGPINHRHRAEAVSPAPESASVCHIFRTQAHAIAARRDRARKTWVGSNLKNSFYARQRESFSGSRRNLAFSPISTRKWIRRVLREICLGNRRLWPCQWRVAQSRAITILFKWRLNLLLSRVFGKRQSQFILPNQQAALGPHGAFWLPCTMLNTDFVENSPGRRAK